MSRLIDKDELMKSLNISYSCSDCKYENGAVCSRANRALGVHDCEIICNAPTVDAIPTAWIREQMCEYPGMESAMWSKLLRIWKREAKK